MNRDDAHNYNVMQELARKQQEDARDADVTNARVTRSPRRSRSKIAARTPNAAEIARSKDQS